MQKLWNIARLGHFRVEQGNVRENIAQTVLAERSGVSLNAVKNLENGGRCYTDLAAEQPRMDAIIFRDG